jgi:hypothetical protein
MKYLSSVIGLTFWLLFTLLLSCTILGIVAVMDIKQYWQIPNKLLKVFDS